MESLLDLLGSEMAASRPGLKSASSTRKECPMLLRPISALAFGLALLGTPAAPAPCGGGLLLARAPARRRRS